MLLVWNVGSIPTIKNSPKTVASTDFGNIPFRREATLASVILASLPPAWRNQYSLTHITVPESPRAMIDSLESIKTLFVGKGHKKARAKKAKATEAYKAIGDRVPRKGKQEGGSKKGAPKKGHSAKYCRMCKAAGGSFNTHNTAKCRRFEKDGKPKASSVKPFDSVKKPWKRPGSRKASQITYLTKKMAKLKNKLKKKRHSKKRAHDLSDSDSDSD